MLSLLMIVSLPSLLKLHSTCLTTPLRPHHIVLSLNGMYRLILSLDGMYHLMTWNRL